MEKPKVSRRQFLQRVGALAGSAFLIGNISGISSPRLSAQELPTPPHCDGESLPNLERADAAYHVRESAAHLELENSLPAHNCNGDEQLYQYGEVSFGKGLPHNELGEPKPAAYYALLRALETGHPDDFAQIPMEGDLKLANPQAAFAFELEGPDSHRPSIRSAPAFTDQETASEMVECYWHALLRDVHFDEYEGNNLANSAVADLNRMSTFLGPKEPVLGQESVVTMRTLFRGNTPGDIAGPYISQFLLQSVPLGAIPMNQHMATTMPQDDFMTSFDEWLDVQQGFVRREYTTDATLRYIRNGRDLGEYVHKDFPGMAGLNAALVLLKMGVPFDAGNPYVSSPNQDGFATFGVPHLVYLVESVANRALKAAWFHKWLVNRRLRPEALGARVHNTLTGLKAYVMHNDVLNSRAVQEIFSRHGTYLLPQAYPEGSPTHPSYPAGHATFTGACVTMLKAFFDESAVIPDPVRVSADGLELVPYTGPDLTVGGELNKLAANISLGRDFAGVHYRSDGIEGMNLGEKVAIGVLRELRLTYNENFEGFTFTQFNGQPITV